MSKKTKKSSRKKRGEKLSPPAPSRKYLPVKIILPVAILLGGAYFYDNYTRVYPIDTSKITSANVEILRGGETRSTLSPVQFIGETARAYSIANENRELLDSMFCYCNCKKNSGHKSLLSCYADNHAANCKICLDQTFYAYSQFQQAKDISQVRIAVDKKFWKPLS